MSLALALLVADAGQAPGTNVVTLSLGPPQPGPSPWAGPAIGAALTLAAAAFARRRAATGAPGERPSRAGRIVAAASGWGAAAALMLAPRQISLHGADPFVLELAGRFLVASLFAGVLFAALDLTLDLFRPERTRASLWAAVPLFVLLPPSAVAATGLSGEPIPLGDLDPVTMALAGLPAALIWWSSLPRRDSGLVHVFE